MAADLRNQLFAALAAGRTVQPGPVRRNPPVLPLAAAPAAPTAARPNGGIAWGGQYFNSPAELVAWMNARGAGTNVNQFLGNHPGVASAYGQRQPMAAPPRRPTQPLYRAIQSDRRAYTY